MRWPRSRLGDRRRGRSLSGFAEGADELVAERALERGWELHALLPLPVDDFADDMERPADFRRAAGAGDAPSRRSRRRCRGPTATAPRASRWSTRSDELVALWNGAAARGAGGTGEIVAAARARGLHASPGSRPADVRDGVRRASRVTHVEERG